MSTRKSIHHAGGRITRRGTSWRATVWHHSKRERATFPDIAGAKTWLEAKRLEFAENITPLTAAAIIDHNRARSLLPPTVTLYEAAQCWQAAHASPNAGESIKSLAAAFLADRRAAGARNTSMRQLQYQAAALCAACPGQAASAVTLADVERALSAYRGWTRDGYRRSWHALFAYGIRRGSCRSNPTTGVSKVLADDSTPQILTVAQAAAMLRAAWRTHKEVVGYLAIAMFAGLRTSELYNLTWDDIGESIRVLPEVAKKRHQRLVELQPRLKRMLALAPRPSARVAHWHRVKLDRVIREIEKEARVEIPPNGLRHSYCSYHAAAFHDLARTAEQAGNSVGVIVQNYRQLVTEKAGLSWFGAKKLAPRKTRKCRK